MDVSGEVAQIDVQHHRSERFGEQGVDEPRHQIPEALVDGIGDPVEEMVDVDVMDPQIVEDVVGHADDMECFLFCSFLRKVLMSGCLRFQRQQQRLRMSSRP